MSSKTGAPPLHALLVGIDHYPDSDLYPDLGGCAADVAAMERYLVDVLEIRSERIETLVASGDPAARRLKSSGGASTAEPTYEGLTAALRRLEARCRAGEHALFHFSGHGGRTPTAFPDRKGPAGKDECLAPVDIADPATRYLRDVEIDAWIRRMVDKDVFVTLVVDCCHSGGIRRTGGTRVRGGRAIDPAARPVDSLLATPEELARVLSETEAERVADHRGGEGDPGRPRAAWNGGVAREPRRCGGQVYRHAEATGASRAENQGYALFAACRGREKAHELTLGGGRSAGALTHFLLQGLQRLGHDASYRQLHAAVVTGVHSRFRNQTPVFEGESRAFPLGHRELPRLRGLEVIEVLGTARNQAAPRNEAPPRPVELHIGGGRVQGVGEGARFRVLPLSEGRAGSSGPSSGVTAEVVETGAATCRAVVRGTAPRRLRPGDRAVLLDPGTGGPRSRVALASPPSPAAADMVAEIRRRLAECGNGWLTAAADGGAELRVRFGPEGRILVCDETDAELPHLPRLCTEDPGATESLWRSLDHLARYESLRRRQSSDLASPLYGMIELELEVLPESEDRSENGSLRDAGRSEGMEYPPEVATGRELVLVVRNRSYLPVHFVLLDLQPDWGISQIVPDVLGSLRVDAQSDHPIGLRSHLPERIEAGTDVLKVLAAEEPLDCRWMELPPLAEVVAGRSSRRTRRSFGPLGNRAWVTAQTEVRVVRRA